MMSYNNEKTPQECEDRAYWRKRFNFAAWLFLFFALWFLFTDNFTAMFIALAVSLGYRTVDTILDIRHMKWHINNDEGEHPM